MPTTITKQPNKQEINESHNFSHPNDGGYLKQHHINMTEVDGRRGRVDSASPHQEISPLSIS